MATEGRGVEDVFEKLEAYRVHLNTGGRLARLRGVQAKREVKERLREVVLARLDARWDAGEMEAAVAEVCGGGKDPYRVAMEVARGYV